MSRTVSARIPNEMHENLREQCNKVGSSINDFIQASIELALTGHTEFDFGDEENILNKKPSIKETPKAVIVRVDD